MRIGFRVLDADRPVPGARVYGTLTVGTPLPVLPAVLVTDRHGEAFGVAPLAVGLADYYLYASVEAPGREPVVIHGVFDEIANLFLVDAAAGTWRRERLPARILGDGWHEVDDRPLRAEDIVHDPTDPMLRISNCAQCLYFAPGGAQSGLCLVNGPRGPVLPIVDAPNSTSRLYRPFFLPPSLATLARDVPRFLPVLETDLAAQA